MGKEEGKMSLRGVGGRRGGGRGSGGIKVIGRLVQRVALVGGEEKDKWGRRMER